MTAWTEHIKDFAKRKGMTYGCALSDPECKAEYHAKRPPKLNKKEKKEVAGMEAQDINVAQKENIQMTIEEKKKGRGRPKKYETDEERKKAKSAKTIESNKRKRAEKKAKATEGSGMPKVGFAKPIGGMPNPMSDPEFAKKYMEEKAKMSGKGAIIDHLKSIFTGTATPSEYVIFVLMKIALYFIHKKSKKILKDRYGIEGSWFPVLKLLAEGTKEAYQRAFTDHPDIVRNIARIAVDNLPDEVVGDIETGGAGFKPAEKMAEYLGKVQEALPTAIKRTIRQGKDTAKLIADNKAKILAEDKAKGATGGGLIAGYSTEGHNGLTHIYPLSHAHILQMCKHLI